MRFSFILLAGGDGNRFKSKIPKQYHEIAGKTLVDISVDKIRTFKEVKKIVLVYNKEHKKYLKKINLKNISLIIGGKTRDESTLKALSYLKKQNVRGKVLIHDAARPNFSKKLIKDIIINSHLNKVVVPILKIQDALKEKRNKNKILNIERNNFFLTQTPQSFNLNEIFHLHKKKKLEYKDDDLSLIDTSLGIKFINGEKKNFKITDIDDFELLKNFNKSNQKIGIGFDVHRLVKGRKLLLGGIEIPSKLGTLGHSDGDPVLHSIIDALLGACTLGDIGKKFSDKSKKFKNIKSSILVKEVIDEVKEKNYVINNIDVNIITQYPKLKKYKKKITKNIAKLCQISVDNINIKAKTTEKLGVIGREQAIAAEVIMSVIKYD
jgi:2-C-methyl-D-erythritol 4-phosphate cytidylyltransferase/2-C-methyl-D-erythritol 2,4-cyclodiphosphate synthase|tara:strand:+ start:8073 stop:9209 length:1137 start_codon:yes stop_codon:yes gene_type:complete